MYIHKNLDELNYDQTEAHKDYRYRRSRLVRPTAGSQTKASVYQIPPGAAAYPYHYHLKNEETFFIISGQGLLRTPEGEREIRSGDLLHFPAGAAGAHKLTNLSQTEPLVYLDFDVAHPLDVALYPDSRKVGIWGTDFRGLYRLEDQLDYYDGE